RVYLAVTNQQANLLVVDVSEVGNMRLLGTLGGIRPHAIAARGDHVFLAVEGDMEPAGLRIVDVSDGNAPVLVGSYTGCDIWQGTAIDVSPDGATAYLGCDDGVLRILDTRDVTAPVLIGTYSLPEEFNTVASLVVKGNTAYLGHGFGIDEIDISDPASPVQSARHATPDQPNALAISPNGSLLAFAYSSGTFYFTDPSNTQLRGHGHHARPPALRDGLTGSR
ncbi:MAG: LVIVD repeat-containing protein, partial [Rhodanobacteraceae bacterium]